jgi:trigger factor
MEPEQTREFDLPYPEDHYNAEIAGKTGHFEVKLDEIRVEVLPALDDEFAMTVGDYEDLEDLRTKLRASLLEEAEASAEQAYQEQIWEALLEMATIEYPEVLVERELASMRAQLEQRLQQQGIDLETYFKLTGSSEEEWTAQARPQAVDNIKRTLVVGELIEQEDLEAGNDEIDAEIDGMLGSLGDQADQLRAMFAAPRGRLSVADSILTRKAVEQITAIARGEDPHKGGERLEAEEEAEDTAEPESEVPVDEIGQDEAAADELEAEDDDVPEPEPQEVTEQALASSDAGKDNESSEVSGSEAAEAESEQTASALGVEIEAE